MYARVNPVALFDQFGHPPVSSPASVPTASPPVQADARAAAPHQRRRFRLALVVGSGGVRSIAVLGFVQGLRDAGLSPDLLVGCSAGAMASALIATGIGMEEGIEMAATLWTADVTRQSRRGAVAQMLWPRWLGFDGDFSLRRDDLVRSRLKQVFGDTQIEHLPTPLRVVATCIETGSNACIDRGSVVDALRASIGIPFLFAPQHIEGQRMVDGFLSDPLPVSAATDAHLTIAIGFVSPQPKRIDKPQRLLGSITSTMTNSLMYARLAAAEGQGQKIVSVFPEFERRVGLFDVEAMPHVVAKGREAALKALPRIEQALARQMASA